MKGGFSMKKGRERELVMVSIEIPGAAGGKCLIDGGPVEVMRRVVLKVDKGGTLTLKAVEEPGYEFVGWLINGKSAASVKEVTYVIKEEVEFKLLFSLKEEKKPKIKFN